MANFNFNKVIIGGRLTEEPELKTTNDGVSVLTVQVAVNRRATKNNPESQADFFRVVMWREKAEFVSRFFHKGSSICVDGTLQTRSWTNQAGQKQFITEILANEIHFVDSKGENSRAADYQTAGVAMSYASDSANSKEWANAKLEYLSDDEELPF